MATEAVTADSLETRPAGPDEQVKAATHNGRLDFLDAIRGIAAFMVALQHVGERLLPSVSYGTSHFLQLGQFGVMAFFLTSGFIIPNSIERSHTLQQFWIRRICRIYPLYIFSMIVAILLYFAGRYDMMPIQFVHSPLLTVAFNLSMLQDFLSRGNIVPLYWTLNFEMAFYVMVSGLFVIGLLKKSIHIATMWLSLALVAGYVVPNVLHSHSGNGLIFNFAAMFTGTVIYRWHQGRVSGKQVAFVLSLACAAIVTINWSYFHGHDDPTYLGARSFVPMTTAWLGALVIFVAGYGLRKNPVPAFLRYLGKISYSVYLMQFLVLALAPTLFNPWLTAGVWLALIVAVSGLTYTVIERPGIEAGRRWGRSLFVRPVLLRESPAE